jgi:hypothetical protein
MSGEFTPANTPAILADHFMEKGVDSSFELAEAVRELFLQIPLRSQPAKADSAPAWIPRSMNGYIVLTCLDCLRSFSILITKIAIDEVGSETCIHCGEEVRYRIDGTVLPIATEIPPLLERLQNRVEKARTTIKHTKDLIRSSKRVF